MTHGILTAPPRGRYEAIGETARSSRQAAASVLAITSFAAATASPLRAS